MEIMIGDILTPSLPGVPEICIVTGCWRDGEVILAILIPIGTVRVLSP